MINARAETVQEKPAYRSALRSRRCLIPSAGFYEWQKTGADKQPHLLRHRDLAPFAAAGIWGSWHGADAKPLESCTIVGHPGEHLDRKYP
jgi:putative SOS response-associated peptidase YedK